MYRVYRYTQYPQYWPSEATVYVDSAPGTVEEYVTDNNGTPTLVGNYIGTVTYPTFASFPTVGRTNRLYIDGSTNILYRWTGSAYVSVGGTSTIPTLDDVLVSGNTSLENAFVNSIGVWDSAAGKYATIVGVDDGIEIYSANGAFLFRVQSGYLVFGTSTIEASFDPSSLTHSRNYILPNANGTVALTSDITIKNVTVSAPLSSSGGATPNITTSMLTNRLIGRSSAGTGVMEEIAIGSGLSLSGGTLSATGGGIPHATASGTDTYTTPITGVTAYTDGDAYLIQFTNGNTDASTLNINSLGARSLYRNNDGAIIGGDIVAGGEMLCIYDSTITGFRLIGTSPNTLFAYVVNADSVAITRGQPVYAFGSTGNRMSVKRAYNTTDSTSAQTYGLVYSSSIAANQKGIIIIQGVLDGINLGGTWVDGDPVYLGSTPGSLTKTKPYAPNHLVYLGVVERANAGNSIMYVRVQNGYELDELHNVQAQSPSNKDTLYYDLASTQWKTDSIPNILGSASGDLTGTYPGPTIATGAVTLAKMANLATGRIIGNNSGSTGIPLALTSADVTEMLNLFSTAATTKGLVPGSNGVGSTYFLRADGTWAVPAGGGGGSSQNLEATVAWDGNGSFITGSNTRYVVLSNGGTISGWSIVAIGTSPTCTIDVLYVAPGGTALPTLRISSGSTPALATGNSIYSNTLTSWTTTTIAAGGTLGFRITAISNVLQLKITLIYS